MKKLLLIVLLIVGCDNSTEVEQDTTAPSVLITFPANQSTLTAPTTVKADVTDDTDIASVAFLINGTEAFADSTAPYEYEWDVCVSGTGTTPTLMVKATDSAGNAGQSEVYTFTINATYDCASVCGGDNLLDNCDACDANTTNDCTAYSQSDLEGTWIGDIVVEDAPNSGTYQTSVRFDSQGNCVAAMGSSDASGKLNVSNIGEITGTITFINNTDEEIETNTVDLEGSYLSTKTKMSIVSSNCNWTNTNGNSGSYSLSGILDKSTDNSFLGSTYEVYGGSNYISEMAGYNPAEFGYILIGSNTTTAIFQGSYNFYCIVTQPGNITYVDAVQGSNGIFYGTSTTGNTIDYENVDGEPDDNAAAIGGEFDGIGGYILIDASGISFSHITVYIKNNE